MERLAENRYKLDITKVQKKKFGFRYDHSVDDYTYIFPVYKYKGIVPTIYCKLGVDEETKIVWFNVCDDNDRLYAPYYNDEYGKNLIVQDIEKIIIKEFKKLGVKKVN